MEDDIRKLKARVLELENDVKRLRNDGASLERELKDKIRKLEQEIKDLR